MKDRNKPVNMINQIIRIPALDVSVLAPRRMLCAVSAANLPCPISDSSAASWVVVRDCSVVETCAFAIWWALSWRMSTQPREVSSLMSHSLRRSRSPVDWRWSRMAKAAREE